MAFRFIPGFIPPADRKSEKKLKYRNQKTIVDGITFDSKVESQRYQELKILKKMDRIKWFSRQPSFILPGGKRYRPDFIVCDMSGRIWVEDVKGMETEAFKIKKSLWDEAFPGLPLKVIR